MTSAVGADLTEFTTQEPVGGGREQLTVTSELQTLISSPSSPNKIYIAPLNNKADKAKRHSCHGDPICAWRASSNAAAET